jgi:hypothetical protein
MLKAGVTQTIHQRLRDEDGVIASVASLTRYVAANLPEEVRRDRVVVLRDEADAPPGARWSGRMREPPPARPPAMAATSRPRYLGRRR